MSLGYIAPPFAVIIIILSDDVVLILLPTSLPFSLVAKLSYANLAAVLYTCVELSSNEIQLI
jgi:hypothetical protein